MGNIVRYLDGHTEIHRERPELVELLGNPHLHPDDKDEIRQEIGPPGRDPPAQVLIGVTMTARDPKTGRFQKIDIERDVLAPGLGVPEDVRRPLRDAAGAERAPPCGR